MNKITRGQIEKMIYLIRGKKVLLDKDLAILYEVETKALKRAVRRNIKRFPEDFMFELTKDELNNWRCQFGTSNKEKMGLRVPPFAFTEQGIAMLSSILNSDKAIEVNISIMRIFVKIREFLSSDEMLIDRLRIIESNSERVFRIVFERLEVLEKNLPLYPKDRRKIGLNKQNGK